MSSIDGFILAGGRSSRMGRDKASLSVGGQTFVERVLSALTPLTTSVRLVGNHPDQLPTNLEKVPDVFENWGALGGLHAALAAAHSEWTIIVACDLPFVTSELFAYLARLRGNSDAVAPIQLDGRPQPLCALYRVNPCLQRASDLIESGERRPIALLQSVKTRWVKFDELSNLDGSGHFFDNINTPDDFVRATAKERQVPG